VFSIGVEGKATTMVMEALGEGMFPVTLVNNPQIEVIANDGQGSPTSVIIDAIPAWGGVGATSDAVNLLLINRDDENAHMVAIDIPSLWQADHVVFESLYGTMIDETVMTTYDDSPFTGSTYSVLLPSFSVNKIQIHLGNPLGLNALDGRYTETYIYPNPSSDFISFSSKQQPLSISIFNSLGQKVAHQPTIVTNKIAINELEKGIYFIRFIYSNSKESTSKFVKQ
jgi:hypothetical protein